MKVLSLSDKIVPFIYSPQIRNRFSDIELIIGCGDLSYFYLEFVLSMMDKPLFYVRGNHDKIVEYQGCIMRTKPHGGINLHRRVVRYNGLLLAGVEGSLRYRPGVYQYTQSEMWRHTFALIPALFLNRIKFGRYLDIFVTHAPPKGIHDGDDLPHQGINAFRWLLHIFHPMIHYHGHVHIYRPDIVSSTVFGKTRVINTYPSNCLDLNLE